MVEPSPPEPDVDETVRRVGEAWSRAFGRTRCAALAELIDDDPTRRAPFLREALGQVERALAMLPKGVQSRADLMNAYSSLKPHDLDGLAILSRLDRWCALGEELGSEVASAMLVGELRHVFLDSLTDGFEPPQSVLDDAADDHGALKQALHDYLLALFEQNGCSKVETSS